MAIYYDELGNVLKNPDLENGYIEPKEIIHHEYVPAITHIETITFPGGSLTYTVIDTPAQAEWDEIVSYTYHTNPPSTAAVLNKLLGVI